MHWLATIAMIWILIYASSLLFALTAKAFLPITSFQAAMAGLIIGLFGVLYFVGSYADQRLRAIIGDATRLNRPTVTVGGENNIEEIIEELEDQE